MGDLKKKKQQGNASSDEEVIERLRGYIKKFYEIQIEKMEKAEQENSKKEKDEE